MKERRDEIFNLKRYRGEGKAPSPVLVVPNGYGCLDYVDSVCSVLSAEYLNVLALSVPGQDDLKGTMSLTSASQSLRHSIVTIASSEGSSLRLVMHCSSAMYLHCVDKELFSYIDNVLIYSYLHYPQKHIERFRALSEKYGSSLADDLDVGDITGYEYLQNVAVNIDVIHPDTARNKMRASKKELAGLLERGLVRSIRIPSSGYEISDDSDKSLVKQTVQRHIIPFL